VYFKERENIKMLPENLKETDNLLDPDVEERTLTRKSVRFWIRFLQRLVAGCCEHGNELLVSIKDEEVLDWLSD
jgi:hypothetical protein